MESVFNVFGKINDGAEQKAKAERSDKPEIGDKAEINDKAEISDKPKINGEAENSSAGEKTGFQLLGLMERRDRMAFFSSPSRELLL